MRVSGVRSSCDALASSILCERISSSMRRRRAVEARRERRDLVLALDLHARREVAFAELVDAGFQPLQPAREPPRQRPGADRDRDRDQAKRDEQPWAGTPRPAQHAGHEKAAVAQREQPGALPCSRTERPGPPSRAAAAGVLRSRAACRCGHRARDRRAGGGASCRSPPAGARAGHPAAAVRGRQARPRPSACRRSAIRRTRARQARRSPP